jgi:oligoribonuclease
MLGIFLDMETTGLDPLLHRSLEIAIKIYSLKTGQLRGSYEQVIRQSPDVWNKSDPISLKVNGFTWEMVCGGAPEAEVSREIVQLLNSQGVKRGQAVFIGQNSSFDRGFFGQLVSVYEQEKHDWPYHWLDLASMFWAIRMREHHHNGRALPDERSLSKNEIAKSYAIVPEAMPHRAMNGVEHLIQCYNAVVNMESGLLLR